MRRKSHAGDLSSEEVVKCVRLHRFGGSTHFGVVVAASSVSVPSCAGDAAGTSGGDPALGVSAAPALSPLF